MARPPRSAAKRPGMRERPPLPDLVPDLLLTAAEGAGEGDRVDARVAGGGEGDDRRAEREAVGADRVGIDAWLGREEIDAGRDGRLIGEPPGDLAVALAVARHVEREHAVAGANERARFARHVGAGARRAVHEDDGPPVVGRDEPAADHEAIGRGDRDVGRGGELGRLRHRAARRREHPALEPVCAAAHIRPRRCARCHRRECECTRDAGGPGGESGHGIRSSTSRPRVGANGSSLPRHVSRRLNLLRISSRLSPVHVPVPVPVPAPARRPHRPAPKVRSKNATTLWV